MLVEKRRKFMETLSAHLPKLAEIQAPRKSVVKSHGRRAVSAGTSSARTCVSFEERRAVYDWVLRVETIQGFQIECMYCGERLVNSKQRLDDHQKSKKHIGNVERGENRDVKRAKLQELLASDGDVDSNTIRKRVRRIEILRSFLKSGTPVERIRHFEEILCEGQPATCSPSHMLELIPVLHQQQVKLAKEELSRASCFTLTFDGTCRLGEAFCMVARFVNDAFEIRQLFLKFVTVTKSMTGKEIAALITKTLMTEFQVQPEKVIAFARDRASSNNVAVTTVTDLLFSKALDIGCFAHTLNNAGEAATTSELLKFSQLFATLFSKSPANKLFWKTLTNLPLLPTVSETRWWSRFNLYQKLYELWPDVVKLITHDDFAESSKETRKQLRQVIRDHGHQIRVELAVMVDSGSCFYRATYALEGDGELITAVYDMIEAILQFIREPTFPSLDPILDTVTLRPEGQASLREYAMSCVQPMFHYFKTHFTNADAPLRSFLDLCKAARVFHPSKFLGMSDTAREDLAALIFLLGSKELAAMSSEKPAYIHLATEYDVEKVGGVMAWWTKFGDQLPAWKRAGQKVFALAPSSASVERVFSKLNFMFSDLQTSAKADLIETALLLRCNDPE